MDFLLKCLYFFSGFSSAAGPLYLPLYLDHHFLLEKDQIGILLSLIPVISIFSTPLMTWVGEHKIGLKNAGILCAICGLVTFDLYATVQTNTAVTMSLIVGLCILNALFASPIGTLLDSLVLILSQDYGKQRMWCSISWGLGSLGTGLVIDYFGLDFMFVLFTGSSLIFLLLLSFLPRSSTAFDGDTAQLDDPQLNDEFEGQVIQEDEEARLLEKPQSNEISLSQVLLRPSTSFFLLSITLIGMVFSLIQSFLFIYMSSELLISPSIIGLTTPLSILLELPVFYYSEKLIKVAGTTTMIVSVHVLLIARLLIYMVLNQKSAIFILPVELIHGLAFALTWAAGLENSKKIAPAMNKSTFVSIFCTLYNNVGGFLGTYIGGKIYQDYGHIYLWIFCILLLLISIISFLASIFLIRGDSMRENRTET